MPVKCKHNSKVSLVKKHDYLHLHRLGHRALVEFVPDGCDTFFLWLLFGIPPEN